MHRANSPAPLPEGRSPVWAMQGAGTRSRMTHGPEVTKRRVVVRTFVREVELPARSPLRFGAIVFFVVACCSMEADVQRRAKRRQRSVTQQPRR
jgi:hypothetical protein